MKTENYGWICPKCGMPNAPTNLVCVACTENKVDVIGKMLPEEQLKKNETGPTLLTEDK